MRRRFSAGVGALLSVGGKNPGTEEENADGQVYRTGRTRVQLHAGGGRAELGTQVVETNARALIEVLRGVPKRRHLCMEEGTLSEWLNEVLEPYVDELVVTGVGRKSPGPKSDKEDAFGLAEQLRIGAVETRVYKGRGRFGGWAIWRRPTASWWAIRFG